MSAETKAIRSGDTLALRLTCSRRSLGWGLFVMVVGFAILTFGVVGFGALALAVFRESIVLGLIIASMALLGSGFGLWVFTKCLGEFRTALVVAPTVVEISAGTLHPGQTVELLVAQPGPLRSKRWRVALVGEEHTVAWATAPDPNNAQGEISQPYSKSRPVSVVEIALRHDLTISRDEEHRECLTFTIPADAIPQTWSRHRSVTWGVVVEGDANGWPKFARVFPVALVGVPVQAVS